MLSVLDGVDRLAFIPFAVFDRSRYGVAAAGRFKQEGIDVDVVTADEDGREILQRAAAVFVGGGNTFRLLKALQDSALLEVVRRRVVEGMIYMGASAGSNIAGPTIRTTNDMPIVQPRSFDALGLVPFQINPHYVDADSASSYMGETREQRLTEYLEENEMPVVGIREGAWIRLDDDDGVLGGRTSARILQRNAEPEERPPGASISDLL